MHKDLCGSKPGLCEAMRPIKGTDLLQYLRTVEFKGKFNRFACVRFYHNKIESIHKAWAETNFVLTKLEMDQLGTTSYISNKSSREFTNGFGLVNILVKSYCSTCPVSLTHRGYALINKNQSILKYIFQKSSLNFIILNLPSACVLSLASLAKRRNTARAVAGIASIALNIR